MKAFIDRPMWRNTVRVYVVDPSGPNTRRLWQYEGKGVWKTEEVKEGVDVDLPTIEMPVPMLEAIVAAAHDILPPSAAVERHLKDALGVRDRLLTIVAEVTTAHIYKVSFQWGNEHSTPYTASPVIIVVDDDRDVLAVARAAWLEEHSSPPSPGYEPALVSVERIAWTAIVAVGAVVAE